MSTQQSADRTAMAVLGLHRRPWVVATSLSAVLLLGACAAPPPLAGHDPSDPSVPVAGVGYRSTLSGYRNQRPVEPGPWIEQNQGVAPNPERGR